MTYFQVFIAQYQMVSQLNNEHQTTNKMKKMKHSRTLPSKWDEVFDAYPFKGRSLQDGRKYSGCKYRRERNRLSN